MKDVKLPESLFYGCHCRMYSLLGTSFTCYPHPPSNNFTWYEIVNRKAVGTCLWCDYLSGRKYRRWRRVSESVPGWNKVTLEEVMDNCSDEIRDYFLFNLDLFS